MPPKPIGFLSEPTLPGTPTKPVLDPKPRPSRALYAVIVDFGNQSTQKVFIELTDKIEQQEPEPEPTPKKKGFRRKASNQSKIGFNK